MRGLPDPPDPNRAARHGKPAAGGQDRARRPKVNYFEVYVADTDCLKVRTVAANNNVGEEWLRDLLIDKGWIYVETERRYSESKGCVEIRRRYSAYAHKRSYFKPIETHEAPRFKGEVMHTLKITPHGAEAVARLIAREVAA
ncbi:phage antirepressor KilAC domain-containing protein [Mycobacterium sp. BK086]|uniref:phage antirepressor KilAC domain-containing protein n=1 Tax=Mycobacterium sp. BK086 TaxID=2512165 RepID=UPI00105D5EFA|nr:phage antirepressor KilAC domain-containing protein [Mycobacterium sp. BK086]